MKENIINILNAWKWLKTLDFTLSIIIVAVLAIIIILQAKTRNVLIKDIPKTLFDLYTTVIFRNKIIGTVFLLIIIASTWIVYFITKSYTTALLFLIMPFKTMWDELNTIKDYTYKPILKIFIRLLWEYEKSLLEWSVGYYLLILKLPSGIKNIILYGIDNFKEVFMQGDFNILILLALLSFIISFLIVIFVIDVKRFAIIEQDIITINGKSKYKRFSKTQIQKVIVATSYFKSVKIKSEALRKITGLNKYEFKDLGKLLKLAMQLHSFLKVKAENREKFLGFIDKFFHCCDDYSICKNAVKQIRKGNRKKAINLMNDMDELWNKICNDYLCYNKKRESLEVILEAIEK